MLIIFKEGRYLHQIQGASRYYVSKCGAVYSDNINQLLKLSPQTDGYLQIALYLDNGTRKRLMVHRLVALQFVHNPDPTSKQYVNHKNGNKNDCRTCNLEWVTAKENDTHARETGLTPGYPKAATLPSIRGFCAPMKDYQTKPRFYCFEPVPTSCLKSDTDATRA